MKELYAISIFDYVVNRDYEGDINDVGSIVNILSLAKVTEQVYTGANMNPQDLFEVNGQLKITQFKSFYWREKTLAKWESYIKNPKGTVLEQTAQERRKNVDKYVLGFYTKIAAGNRVGTDYTTGTVSIDVNGNVTGSGTAFTSSMVGKGFTCVGLPAPTTGSLNGPTKWYRISSYTDATHIAIQLDVYDDAVTAYDGGVITSATFTIQANTPIAITATNIMQNLLKLQKILDDNEVPENDRWVVLPPSISQYIPVGTNIALNVPAAYDELVKKGFITELVGFKIFKASGQRVAGDNVNGWHVIAGQRNWNTFADKVLQVGMEEDLIGNFGSAYKDLYVYDCKVTDNRLKFATELLCTG